MLCSVIIPLYNKEQYIFFAIKSVLDQTHQDFEVIVVDDGSSDGGAAVVRAIDDPRVRLLQQKNGGVSRARNAGIAAARGDLICFLDADDWYAPGFLQAVSTMYRQYKDEHFYSTSFLCMTSPTDGKLDSGEQLAFSQVDNFYEYRAKHGVFYCTNSIAVPRSVLQAMPECFPEGDQFGEDQDLWFRLAESMPLVFSPAKLVAYRMNVADSLCAVHDLRTMPQVFLRLEQRALLLPVKDRTRQAALKNVAHAYVGVARYALKNGRRADAFSALRRAACYDVNMRWVVTIFLCLVGNGSLLKRWETWRKMRECN